MKRLPFRTEMARVWHLGMKSVTRRLVKWPEWVGDIDLAAEELNHHPMVAYYKNGAPWKAFGPTYPVGSTVIIAEPLFSAGGLVAYAADNALAVAEGHVTLPAEWKWKVSRLSGRYMPNWAARSWAKVVSVRVERLQEITDAEAQLEGARPTDGWDPLFSMDQKEFYNTPVKAFSYYIDEINGPGTWAANGYVFRYELEKLNAPPVEVKP